MRRREFNWSVNLPQRDTNQCFPVSASKPVFIVETHANTCTLRKLAWGYKYFERKIGIFFS